MQSSCAPIAQRGQYFSEINLDRNPGSEKIYGDKSCHALVGDFINPSSSFLEGFREDLLINGSIYSRYLDDIKMTSSEASALKGIVTELPDSEEGARRLVQAIQYSRTIDNAKKKYDFYILFNDIIAGNKFSHFSFSRHQKKIEKFRKKIVAIEHEKMSKRPEANRISKESIEKLATRKSMHYEKLTLACKNQNQADVKIGAGEYVKDVAKESNRVAIAMTIGGFGSAVGTYALANWDLEKDERWFKDLAFTVLTSTAISYVNAKFLLANPKLSPWSQRLPLTLASTAVQDAGVSALYGYLFEESNEETLKKIQELYESGQFEDFNNKVISIIEENNLYEKHEAAFSNLIKKVRYDEEGTLDVKHLSDEERSRVKIEDLDEDAIREMFLEAMAIYTYDEQKGPLNIGDPATDRYAFHRLIDLVHQPAFLMTSIIMYKQLCMATNPRLGMLTAISTFMAVNVLMDVLYFYGRRGLINQ